MNHLISSASELIYSASPFPAFIAGNQKPQDKLSNSLLKVIKAIMKEFDPPLPAERCSKTEPGNWQCPFKKNGSDAQCPLPSTQIQI